MTWLKLSDDFAEDCVRARLSDSAYRTQVDGLIWSMRRGTDGYLDHVSVRKGLDSEHVKDAIEELCAAGFWRHEGCGYQIVHHMEHQPEAAVVDARRAATAERVRRHRLKKAGLDSGNASCNALHDSTSQRVAADGAMILVVRSGPGEMFVLEVGDWLTVAYDGAVGRLSAASALMGYQEADPDPEPSEEVPF